MAPCVNWFFGRGLSIGCGLAWSVPSEWSALPRSDTIARIKSKVLNEMLASHVCAADIAQFLSILASHTAPPWQHQFFTTNWDYLLQREIFALGLINQPAWCAETHVYHLNGTVENLPNNLNRSEFILETDPPHARTASIEGSKAFNKFIWNRIFVVVGMSFECEADKYLLRSISGVQDDLPIGESSWYILNPNGLDLANTAQRISVALPRAKITMLHKTFRAWLDEKFPELHACGALN